MTEYQAEAQFLYHSYSVGGCRHASYTCIAGSGENGAILHYGHAAAPNDKRIHDGDMLLFDMGANYFGYAADITCSYPANGKFTADQRFIYNAVLASCQAVHDAARPGVSWVDMHLLANGVLLAKLKEGGLLTGSIGEMIEAGINGVFQPHGLGHLLGNIMFLKLTLDTQTLLLLIQIHSIRFISLCLFLSFQDSMFMMLVAIWTIAHLVQLKKVSLHYALHVHWRLECI